MSRPWPTHPRAERWNPFRILPRYPAREVQLEFAKGVGFGKQATGNLRASTVWIARLLDGEPADVDFVECGEAGAGLLGEQQVVVANGKRLGAAQGAGVRVAHDGGADRIG